MKKKIIPKRIVVACNQKLNWEWESLIYNITQLQSVHDILNEIFHYNYLDGWNKFKRNVIYLNSQNQSLKWHSGIDELKVRNSIKNKQQIQDIFLRPYYKRTLPKYDFLALVKNNENEMGILYIGDRFLIPEVHLKVYSKFFAIAHLFAENFECEPMPANFISGKMLYGNHNLPKAFHDYHKKIHENLNHYFSLGIDHKNRVIDYEKNQPMFIYHWASNQKFIERPSKTITKL